LFCYKTEEKSENWKKKEKICVYLQYVLPKLLQNGAEGTLLFRYKLNKKSEN